MWPTCACARLYVSMLVSVELCMWVCTRAHVNVCSMCVCTFGLMCQRVCRPMDVSACVGRRLVIEPHTRPLQIHAWLADGADNSQRQVQDQTAKRGERPHQTPCNPPCSLSKHGYGGLFWTTLMTVMTTMTTAATTMTTMMQTKINGNHGDGVAG